MRVLILSLVLSLLTGGAALARDLALVVGSRDYERFPRVAGADSVFRSVFALRAAGFDVVSARDADAEALDRLLGDLAAGLGAADRLVILLAGHVVTGPRDSYVLPVDEDASQPLLLARRALGLGALLDLAASKPGGAVVALGFDADARLRLGAGLTTGPGTLAVPQGVTLATGAPEDVTRFVTDGILQPGTTLGAAADRFAGRVEVTGYLGRLTPFLSGAAPAPEADAAELREDGFWQAVQAIGTEAAAEAYLDAYPGGRYRAEAERLRADLRDPPLREAEAREAALNLSRDARRAIQRALVLLGHDTRGIDGIFGPGTRGAIRAWQGTAGLEATGFLDGPQIARLSDQARARREELDREAEARAREEAAREGRYWDRVRQTDTPAAYRAYLDAYPDGRFARDAEARLDDFEREARRNARAEERQAWDRAVSDDSAGAYRQFLRQYPNGPFSAEARARLEDRRGAEANQAERDRLEAAEAQVLGNPILRTLAERRLAELGLDPGAVDGRFDADTRRAIRRYQRDRGLEVTGYVTQDVAVRMLAEAVNP